MSVIGATEFTQEVKDVWLDALRSGDYKQGQNALKQIELDYEGVGDDDQPRRTECFCCLGVLADLANDGNWKPQAINPFTEFAAFTTPDFSILPLGKGAQASLVELNDTKRFTFDQIADVIEVMIPAVES